MWRVFLNFQVGSADVLEIGLEENIVPQNRVGERCAMITSVWVIGIEDPDLDPFFCMKDSGAFFVVVFGRSGDARAMSRWANPNQILQLFWPIATIRFRRSECHALSVGRKNKGGEKWSADLLCQGNLLMEVQIRCCELGLTYSGGPLRGRNPESSG